MNSINILFQIWYILFPHQLLMNSINILFQIWYILFPHQLLMNSINILFQILEYYINHRIIMFLQYMFTAIIHVVLWIQMKKYPQFAMINTLASL